VGSGAAFYNISLCSQNKRQVLRGPASEIVRIANMQDWDEDISRNPFFIHFRDNYKPIFQEAIQKQWIVCVPSILNKGLQLQQFDEKYVMNHIIQIEGSTLKTLANEPVIFFLLFTHENHL
jgi:hypothetical protein